MGNADPFAAGQKDVHIRVFCVALPDGLLRGHRLIIKAVDECPLAVNLVAALVQPAQVRAQQMADGGVQAAAHAQEAFDVLALCIDQNNHPFVPEFIKKFGTPFIEWRRAAFSRGAFRAVPRRNETAQMCLNFRQHDNVLSEMDIKQGWRK